MPVRTFGHGRINGRTNDSSYWAVRSWRCQMDFFSPSIDRPTLLYPAFQHLPHFLPSWISLDQEPCFNLYQIIQPADWDRYGHRYFEIFFHTKEDLGLHRGRPFDLFPDRNVYGFIQLFDYCFSLGGYDDPMHSRHLPVSPYHFSSYRSMIFASMEEIGNLDRQLDQLGFLFDVKSLWYIEGDELIQSLYRFLTEENRDIHSPT